MGLLAMLFHMWDEGLQAVHDAHQVDADNPLPAFRRHLFQRSAGAHAGVVAKDMDITKSGNSPLRRIPDRIRIRNIADQAVDLAACSRPVGRFQAGHGMLQRLCLNIRQHHVGALGQERAGQ